MTTVDFCEGLLHMDVLCVAPYLEYTLAGIGSNLFVYASQSLRLSTTIFKGERVHSIYVKDDLILLKGGRQWSVIKLEESLEGLKCQIISTLQCSDWIQDVIMIDKLVVGLVTAHNIFEVWDLGDEKCLEVISSAEKCILYSCKIIGDCLNNIIVLAGTVFGDILIWGPCWNAGEHTLQRLKGHNGAVFSVEVKQSEKILSTTSDDRTLKIWSVNSEWPLLDPRSWGDSKIQLVHMLYGHTARVWRSLIITDFVVTIGEDSKLVVWGRDGRLLKSLLLHQESGIRALHYSGKNNMITTGGEDGGINMFSLKYLTCETQATKILDFEQNFSTRVCFTKMGFAYTLNGGCVLVSSESSTQEIIYKNEKFLTYCLMEVSPLGDYIILGSIKGHVVIIEADTRVVLVDEKISDGRIYSIHWLDDFLLTCGPNGRLDLWRFSNGILENVKVLELPSCKERWTTCAVIRDGNVIVGDRMGNVHVYGMTGTKTLVRSFRKIHSHLGVTDLIKDGSTVLSTGRDGTVKSFTGNVNHSMTYKLPMEWPWKIVKYNGDTLVLGFHSVSFIVWSMKSREIIATHDCGGGHRSCDFRLTKSKLSFLFVKEKKLFVVDLVLDEVLRIRKGFHGKEINCLKIVQTNPTIIVTGSEDTTVRISRVEKSEIEEIAVLKAHVSSVRAVAACHADSRKLLVLSAGGKGQIVAWTFDLVGLTCEELVNHHLRKESRTWKSSAPEVDPDTRFMCVDVVKAEEGFLIAAGCSDRRLRVFSYGEELQQVFSIGHTHCILKVGFLRADSRALLIASMGTDGRVVFWNARDRSPAVQVGAFAWHQSGINSFHFERVGPGEFVLATGGDDNMISVGLGGSSEKGVRLVQTWRNSQAHSCQITGIKILRDVLLSASIDQRITVWRWRLAEGEVKLELLSQRMTAVADVQGMDARLCGDATLLVALHGKGTEILTVDIGSTDPDEGETPY